MATKAYFETLEAAQLLRKLQGKPKLTPTDRSQLLPVLEGIHRPKPAEPAEPLERLETMVIEIPPSIQTGQLDVPEIVPQPVISGSFETVADFFHRLVRRKNNSQGAK